MTKISISNLFAWYAQVVNNQVTIMMTKITLKCMQVQIIKSIAGLTITRISIHKIRIIYPCNFNKSFIVHNGDSLFQSLFFFSSIYHFFFRSFFFLLLRNLGFTPERQNESVPDKNLVQNNMIKAVQKAVQKSSDLSFTRKI